MCSFALTVHRCDLALALGVPLDIPDEGAAQTLRMMARLASLPELAGPLLLAATGRQLLAVGFSLL